MCVCYFVLGLECTCSTILCNEWYSINRCNKKKKLDSSLRMHRETAQQKGLSPGDDTAIRLLKFGK